MKVEYEARFLNINKDDIRGKLQKIGGLLVRPEFLQRRFVFDFPNDENKDYRWVRVRDERDKVTMTLKVIDGEGIENQKEINLTVDNFIKAEEFLLLIGCQKTAYQENRRETWTVNKAQVTIDEWPFLNPFVEVEGSSEVEVKELSEKLGFNYSTAVFGGIGGVYMKQYNVPYEVVKNNIKHATFETKNPFEG